MSRRNRKEFFREWYGSLADKLGYRFSSDEDLVEFLLDQEVEIEKKHGHPFCPCQTTVGDRERDMRIVCPCIPFHREHFDKMKRCWCGLFVHKDVTDEKSLKQFPFTQ
ncbi:MAG: ferredoxin-thioredoxin reductase catalytic domain-containing protein [Bacillota bacterium]